jgi:hypothetical protein
VTGKAANRGLSSRVSGYLEISRLRGGCDRDRTSHKLLKLLIAVLTDPVPSRSKDRSNPGLVSDNAFHGV